MQDYSIHQLPIAVTPTKQNRGNKKWKK